MHSANVIDVDGSYGEGGGQILRTAVAFSSILGRPVRVSKIRAGRDVPGLRQQHLSALQTLAEIFRGELHGADVGSSEISFSPGRAGATAISVDMKTAASVTLLLQAVIPAVALAGSRVELEVRGGTDVPWSPTFDYFSTVVKPAYGLLGVEFEASASRRGYYPRGGGRVSVKVGPCASLRAVDLVSAGAGSTRADLVSRCGRLPRHVAERQLEAMARILSASGVEVGDKSLGEEETDSPGSSVLASVTGGGRLIGADCLGAKGRSAEEVGGRAAEGLVSAVRSGAAVDSNLADMIAPLLSLAQRRSSLLVPEVSLHLKTGLYVAGLFTGCGFSFEQRGAAHLVTVSPLSGHNA